MATQQNGYTTVPHSTYDEFRAYALTHGVDVDYNLNNFGNQCWDICALLWYQYGLTLVTRPGGNGVAQDCWLISRNTNAQPPFSLIYNVGDIKRGDVIVFRASGAYTTGHIGFADEDYHGNQINIMGQNQGQGSSHGTPSNVITWNLTNFLGAFRNTDWDNTPPTPQPTPTPGSSGKSNFKWVLFGKRARENRL